jgi:hypothetical protein
MRSVWAPAGVVLGIALAGAGAASPAAATGVAQAAQAPTPILWTDPGDVASLDLAAGPGGRDATPAPPFTFEKEDLSGSNPKVRVRDSNGRAWKVKWGREVQADIFASRIAWALGYGADPSYYVASGRIEGVPKLDRAARYIARNGSFRSARFELRDAGVERLSDEQSWTWSDNPFLGTRELNGLKILVMLLSNWDNKDARDVEPFGSNTAIWVSQGPNGARAHYVVSDWGGTMGRWGRATDRWTTWDCRGFSAQSRELVKGVRGDAVRWGFVGQRTSDVTSGISTEDVSWFLHYLGRLSDAQIGAALDASGATPDERECFTRALRERITALESLSRPAGAAPGQTR